MAKIGGPLLSLNASGTIAGTLTFSNWKGIAYARTRVTPANPRSIAQTATRAVFTFLQNLYKFLPGIGREPWIAAIRGAQMTPENLILSKNVGHMRTAADLGDITLAPGSGGGIPPAAATFTAGSGNITVAVTAPSAPSGWTLTSAQAIAIADQDPHDTLIAPPVAAEDTTDPYSIVLAGLTTGQLYQVATWLKWLTATGNVAYSTQILGSATPA